MPLLLLGSSRAYGLLQVKPSSPLSALNMYPKEGALAYALLNYPQIKLAG